MYNYFFEIYNLSLLTTGIYIENVNIYIFETHFYFIKLFEI